MEHGSISRDTVLSILERYPWAASKPIYEYLQLCIGFHDISLKASL